MQAMGPFNDKTEANNVMYHDLKYPPPTRILLHVINKNIRQQKTQQRTVTNFEPEVNVILKSSNAISSTTRMANTNYDDKMVHFKSIKINASGS